MRVLVLGRGAIGSALASALAGRARGIEVVGVVGRDDARRIPELLERTDLLVEVAGHEALAAYGPRAIAGGLDVVVASVGALADPALEAAMRAGPGVLHLPSGAIGGLDLLEAAAAFGGISDVSLTSEKDPAVLGRPWMPPAMLAMLARRERCVVFDGTSREAAGAFPASANVAATLALRTVGLDRCRVRIVAAPDRRHTRHVVEASGAVGSYRFVMDNLPSDINRATSQVTVCSVFGAVARCADRRAPTSLPRAAGG